MNKVSVIVPVYNGERFLPACIRSLLSQSHEDLEILLIDDGSKDASLSLCEENAKRDGRIRVLHHENHGVSYTRNRGLKEFTGDWVTFVDCDDTVDTDYVKVMLEGALAHGTRAAQCRRLEVIDGQKQSFPPREDRLLSRDEALFIGGEFFSPGISCKLYSRALLREGAPLWFDEDIRIGEDHLFWCRAVMKAETVFAAQKALYFYRISTDSAMGRLSFESSYTDFLARERSLGLFAEHPALKSLHVSDWVRVAEETLCLWQKGDDREKKRRLLQCIRAHRKTLLQSPHMSKQEKLKALLIGFAPFRAYWNARQSKKAKRH